MKKPETVDIKAMMEVAANHFNDVKRGLEINKSCKFERNVKNRGLFMLTLLASKFYRLKFLSCCLVSLCALSCAVLLRYVLGDSGMASFSGFVEISSSVIVYAGSYAVP